MTDLDDDLTVDELDAFEASSHGSPEFEERIALVIEVRRHRARLAVDKERVRQAVTKACWRIWGRLRDEEINTIANLVAEELCKP